MHPQHSEWCSILSVIIFEVINRNKHIGEKFCVFCKFPFPSMPLLTPALPLLRLLPVFYLIPPIKWPSPQTWLSKFRSQNCKRISYRESLALDIFSVETCHTFKSYQLFDNIIDTFSAAKARKLCPWNYIFAIKRQIAVFLLFYAATNGLGALKLSLSPGAVNPRYALLEVSFFLQRGFMSVTATWYCRKKCRLEST